MKIKEEERILEFFKEHHGEWICLSEIANATGTTTQFVRNIMNRYNVPKVKTTAYLCQEIKR